MKIEERTKLKTMIMLLLMVVNATALAEYRESFVEAADNCSLTHTTEGTYTSAHCVWSKKKGSDILRIGEGYEDALPVCEGDISTGETVVHYGYPGIFQMRALVKVYGVVTSVSDEVATTSANVHPGMSGGAVTDEYSTCVYGINASVSVDVRQGWVSSTLVRITQ